MDQYPYSIPPGFHPYTENAPDKNTDLPTDTSVPSQNPFYLSGGVAEVPPHFGYGPPPTQEQQQIVPSNPIPSVHANGVMATIPPVGPVGYNAYNNPTTYADQFPATAVEASTIAPLVGMEAMYGTQGFDPQALANQSAMSYPPVVPPVPIQPLERVSSYPMDNIVQPEALEITQDNSGVTRDTVECNSNNPEISDKEQTPLEPPVLTQPVVTGASIPVDNSGESEALGVTQDNSSVASDPVECSLNNSKILDKELAGTERKESEKVQQMAEESNIETNESENSNVAESAACLQNAESPKVPEEVPPPSTNIDTCNASSSTDQNLPPAGDASHAPLDHSTDPPVEADTQRSRSQTPARCLSVSTEDVCTTSAKKKRRRIVTLNDDEDSEDEDISNRMELLRSPEPPMAEGNDDHAADSSLANEEKRHHSRNVDGSDGSEKDHDDEDRPNSSASGTVSIFQNVVMIPAGGDSEAHKRKKIRVLDSDDDEDDQKVLVSVDDIGLTGEGADDLNPGGMLVDENGDNDDLGVVDEQIVAMDAPIIDPSEMMNEDDEDGASEDGEKEKEKSDRELDGGSDVGENEKETSEQGSEAEQDDEELGEEEEIVEEGVEMIAAENDEGEAIGIATDDEEVLGENADQDAASEAGEEDNNRGSDAEGDQASNRSDHSDENERQASESEKEDSDENEEEGEVQNDQSETRSSSASNEQEKEDQDQDGKKSESDDDVVCQNDLELNTISLLTDEEDDNTTPLPPPKKELPVVRIVNIKKELLDDRFARKESTARMDAATSYQQQHYLKKQQQLAQKKREKEKKRKERVFDNNDPFAQWSSSSSDDEFIPNDIYFGTPDRVFTASTKIRCQRQKMLNERYSQYSKPGRTVKRKSGEEPDAATRRKQKQKLEEISRLNLPTYQQQQLQSLVKKKKKSKTDRFYDKSRDIPNDIYFGNVNVPLHILHGFGDSSSDEERRSGNVWRTSQPTSSSSSSRGMKHHSTSKSYKKPASSSYSKSPHSPSNDRSVQAMKEYLKIAGFKNVKFHKLWEGCKSNQERASAILRLMQEKGLEGEPTIAKCRELRKQLQMEREAQVLDTSLIIDSGEGRITRRSARNTQNQLSAGQSLDPNAPSTSGLSQPTVVPPESLETLNRMKNVVDPDSDGEE